MFILGNVCLSTWGGYPISNPHNTSTGPMSLLRGWGTPSPSRNTFTGLRSLPRGYPRTGYPLARTGWGTPEARTGWGIPSVMGGWDTPTGHGWMGHSPDQDRMACTSPPG